VGEQKTQQEDQVPEVRFLKNIGEKMLLDDSQMVTLLN
jgi:hypothetical protein